MNKIRSKTVLLFCCITVCLSSVTNAKFWKSVFLLVQQCYIHRNTLCHTGSFIQIAEKKQLNSSWFPPGGKTGPLSAGHDTPEISWIQLWFPLCARYKLKLPEIFSNCWFFSFFFSLKGVFLYTMWLETFIVTEV